LQTVNIRILFLQRAQYVLSSTLNFIIFAFVCSGVTLNIKLTSFFVGILLVSNQLLDFLNKAIARELQVSIQYMWQHVQVTGTDGAIVEDIFRKTAIAEMKHAERLAEQLDYLNGVPTTAPEPIFVGGSLIEMLTQNQHDEEAAIEIYKEAIQLAAKEGDYTTRRLLEEILADEETHINTFGKLLVGMTEPFTQPGTSQIG
jgi:bacterioferritin